MEKRDIPFLSTAELSELIRQKELSPVEVTESYLERIDALNFKFNSYLTVCREEALQAAQEAEQSYSSGKLPRADARYPRGGKRPIVEQGHTDHRRLALNG